MAQPPHPNGDKAPPVSVIVVNYNGRAFLDDCLAALAAQSYPRDRTEVIVVDNASCDGSADHIRSNYPWVRLLTLPRNLGFAGGNNAGIAASRGEWVALINNDAVAGPEWLGELVRRGEADARLGGVAGKLVFAHDPGVLNSTGLVLLRDGRGADRGCGERDGGQYDDDTDVFGGCGAGLLLRRAMIDDAGAFDARLFMYYEDLDLAWRARLRGWRFAYCPAAVARHVGGGSSDWASPFTLFHVERNRVLVAVKNAGPLLALWVVAGSLARLLRAWWRAARDPARRPAALAQTRAAASAAVRLPQFLLDRLRVRWLLRRVGDEAVRRYMRARP